MKSHHYIDTIEPIQTKNGILYVKSSKKQACDVIDYRDFNKVPATLDYSKFK